MSQFMQSHSSNKYIFSEAFDFRLQLLEFATLFCRRLEPCSTTPSKQQLDEMRQVNTRRARSWLLRRAELSKTSPPSPILRLTISNASLYTSRESILSELHKAGGQYNPAQSHYGESQCLSLSDLLPRFMQLSHTCAQSTGAVSEGWMRCAAQYMQQAALEAILCYGIGGRTGRTVIQECFAWGFLPSPSGDVYDLDHDPQHAQLNMVNDMLKQEDKQCELPAWKNIRDEYTANVSVPAAITCDHLR